MHVLRVWLKRGRVEREREKTDRQTNDSLMKGRGKEICQRDCFERIRHSLQNVITRIFAGYVLVITLVIN